jgi:NADH dehydrogenase
VTGANGHVGRRLIRRLRGSWPRPEVRALVRSERAAQTLRALPDRVRPELVIADYRDEDTIAAAAQGCDRIVHLVGILKQTATARYSEAHETSTTAVARAAEKHDVGRIVYVSILGTDVDSPNACLASKARAEAILFERGTPATILRVPMVLGPGELAATALRARATKGFAFLVRGGASLEQPLDAENLVDALLAAMDDDSDETKRIDLAGPESIPHRELVARAAAVLGREPPRVIPVPYSLVRGFAAVATRLLGNPPITPAMLGVLDHDDHIDPAPACAALGIILSPLDETLRRCFGLEARR